MTSRPEQGDHLGGDGQLPNAGKPVQQVNPPLGALLRPYKPARASIHRFDAEWWQNVNNMPLLTRFQLVC
jgi:hypothetical protein